MQENRVKRVMREGHLAIGTFVSLADPQVVEIIGVAGFDAAFIDMEHTDFDLPIVSEMIRAAELAGVTSLVRVPEEDAKLMMRLLEMGVEGIIVPHVDGLEGANARSTRSESLPLAREGLPAGHGPLSSARSPGQNTLSGPTTMWCCRSWWRTTTQ